MAETDGRKAESVQDSSKGSVASQTQKDEQSTDTVEIRFISFAKKYVGLLATVASIPLISAGIGVLPQPPEGQAKLNLLSSVLCLIMFSACFLLRGPLDKAFTSREHRVLNIIPFVLALSSMFLAILLTSYYIQFSVENAQSTNIDLAPYNIKLSVERYGSYIGGKFVPNRTDIFWQVFMYIWIYPLVVLSLGIVLMTIFTLQHARDIQDFIASRVLDKHEEIFEFVKNYANFYDLSKTFPSPKKAGYTNSLEIFNSKEKKTGNPSNENKDQEDKRDLVNSKKPLAKKDVDRRPLLDIGEEFIIPFYKLLEKLGKGQLEIE